MARDKQEKQADLLQGTLDLLILKAASFGRVHGYGLLLRIEQISDQALSIDQGAIYPAFTRLERQRLLKARWGVSQKNRRKVLCPDDHGPGAA
jgi:PadR family transcriptional regulator PadR